MFAGVGVPVPAAGRRRAAVDVDGLACDVGGQVGGEEGNHAGHLGDRPGSAQRDEVGPAPGGVVARPLEDALGGGDVGGDRVDPYAVGRQFDGCAPREVANAGLGGGIGGVAGSGPVGLDRREVDDAPAQPGVDHRPGHELRAEQDLTEVRPVDGIPALLGGFEERLPEGATGVVDEDRRRAEFGDRFGQRPLDLVNLAHVDREAESVRFNAAAGRVGVPLPDGDPGAEGRQRIGHAAADAGASAGHNGHPAVESDGVRAEGRCVGEGHGATLCASGHGLRVRWRRR